MTGGEDGPRCRTGGARRCGVPGLGGGLTEQARRIGLNQAVFRAVNDEIETIAQRFGLTNGVLDLICECGDGSCAERIHVDHADYVELRRNPRTFAVVPGHEAQEVEDLVARHDGYAIVRKRPGQPTTLAEETDTRP
jgi:hypothetical protein